MQLHRQRQLSIATACNLVHVPSAASNLISMHLPAHCTVRRMCGHA